MSEQNNDSNPPVNLSQINVRDSCDRIAKKYLPQVEHAVEWLLENDPYKGIMAWERIAEFSTAKKSKETMLPNNSNITINLTPAKLEDSEYIDVTDQKKIGEDVDYEENND